MIVCLFVFVLVCVFYLRVTLPQLCVCVSIHVCVRVRA